MTQLPSQSYSTLRQALDCLDLSEEEKRQQEEGFEKLLIAELSEAILKKLPEQDRQGLVSAANLADTEAKKQEVLSRLTSQLGKEEATNLFQKVADKVFTGFLQAAYKDATEKQKKKLEEVFKPETLRG